MEIWSNTDFPYMCLRDKSRTEKFRQVISKVINKQDTVLDIGSGSGILSFFAAEAGAKKVFAVEIDHLLADSLRKSIKLNNLSDVIEVFEGNVLDIKLPKNVNVLIAEIIETGLIDELQIPVLNTLRKKGVITYKTRLIPAGYTTFLQLVNSDNEYYGYKITAPKHEWPFYQSENNGWIKTEVKPASDLIKLVTYDFAGGLINESVDKIVNFNVKKNAKFNGLRLSGKIHMTNNISLGPTNALNGDKVIFIGEHDAKKEVKMRVSYKMGAGLGGLKIKILDLA